MKKIYYDAIKLDECIAFLSTSARMLPAGATIYSMQCKMKNDIYERYAEEFDVHFIFDDDIPTIAY